MGAQRNRKFKKIKKTLYNIFTISKGIHRNPIRSNKKNYKTEYFFRNNYKKQKLKLKKKYFLRKIVFTESYSEYYITRHESDRL